MVTLLAAAISCESQKETGPGGRRNSPPVIASAMISPEKPAAENELSVILQSTDRDGDPITYRYQWIKNSQEMTEQNESTLRVGKFSKGDLIQIRVVPSDGKIEGKPVLTAEVKILNTAPVVREVWIEPKVAYVIDNLKADAKADDINRDFVYFTFQWEKNGVPLPDEKSEILEKGKLKKGDSITVTATPDDRDSQGAAKRSNPLIISNSPPMIVSSPPTSSQGINYRYEIKANDPDNDPIAFSLKSGPKGMEIDKKTGLIKWEVRKEDKGNHSVEIEASDDEGAKSFQRYTLTVDFK